MKKKSFFDFSDYQDYGKIVVYGERNTAANTSLLNCYFVVAKVSICARLNFCTFYKTPPLSSWKKIIWHLKNHDVYNKKHNTACGKKTENSGGTNGWKTKTQTCGQYF